MYETSIHIMTVYVTRKYENWDDIRMILNKLKMSTLEKPKDLDSMSEEVNKDIYIV